MTTTAVREKPILFASEMVQAILDGRKTQTRRIINPQPQPGLDGESREKLVRWRRNVGQTNCRVEERWDNGTLTSRKEFYLPAAEWLLESSPYEVGMHLWVRETWQHDSASMIDDPVFQTNACCFYRADESDPDTKPISGKWRPSIHMPRWASRLTLEITDVRVERVQDITSEDIIAEGVQYPVTEDRSPLIRVSGKCPPVAYHRRINLPAGETLTHDELLQCHFASLWDTVSGEGSWESSPWVWAITFRKVMP